MLRTTTQIKIEHEIFFFKLQEQTSIYENVLKKSQGPKGNTVSIKH